VESGRAIRVKKDGSIKQEARLAKEVEIALPHELNKEQRQALVTELCQSLVKAYGVAVDVAIHAPHVHGEVMKETITPTY
jgi:ATP-dependent exoDNAse (exonuclease V) alpha subunit